MSKIVQHYTNAENADGRKGKHVVRDTESGEVESHHQTKTEAELARIKQAAERDG